MTEQPAGTDPDGAQTAFPWAAGWSGPAGVTPFRWRPRSATAVAGVQAAWTSGFRPREV